MWPRSVNGTGESKVIMRVGGGFNNKNYKKVMVYFNSPKKGSLFGKVFYINFGESLDDFMAEVGEKFQCRCFSIQTVDNEDIADINAIQSGDDLYVGKFEEVEHRVEVSSNQDQAPANVQENVKKPFIPALPPKVSPWAVAKAEPTPSQKVGMEWPDLATSKQQVLEVDNGTKLNVIPGSNIGEKPKQSSDTKPAWGGAGLMKPVSSEVFFKKE